MSVLYSTVTLKFTIPYSKFSLLVPPIPNSSGSENLIVHQEFKCCSVHVLCRFGSIYIGIIDKKKWFRSYIHRFVGCLYNPNSTEMIWHRLYLTQSNDISPILNRADFPSKLTIRPPSYPHSCPISCLDHNCLSRHTMADCGSFLCICCNGGLCR